MDERIEMARRYSWAGGLIGAASIMLVQLLNEGSRITWYMFLIALCFGMITYGAAYIAALTVLRPHLYEHDDQRARPAASPQARAAWYSTHAVKMPGDSAPVEKNGASERPKWASGLDQWFVPPNMLYLSEQQVVRIDVSIDDLRAVAKARYSGDLPEVSERSLDSIGINRSSGAAKTIKDWLLSYGFIKEIGPRQPCVWTETADRFFPAPIVVGRA